MIFYLFLTLLLLSLPFQLGYHFWPDWSYLAGLRIDYLSPTIYVQDLLLIINLSLWLSSRPVLKISRTAKNILMVCAIVACLNITTSVRPPLAVLAWLRFVELSAFSVFVFYHRREVLLVISKILPLIVLFQFALVIIQLLSQSSVGGLFWLFGERPISLHQPGLAKVTWLSLSFLRPYGTFSHPNSLAGFFLILLSFMGFIKNRLLHQITCFSLVSLILLSFSRLGWIILIILSVFFLIRYSRRYWPLLLTPIPFILIFVQSTIVDQSLPRRLLLLNETITLIKTYFLVGVGLGNFIPALIVFGNSPERWLLIQPVHNIFFLFVAETGLLGVLTVFTIIEYMRHRVVFDNSFILPALVALIVSGIFDHYWFTLVQNQYLLFMLIGVSFRLQTTKV